MTTETTSVADRFLALLRPLERELETYAHRLVWEPQDATDALQNAVLRAYAAFDRYRENASFRAWLYKILTREIFALNRRHARIARHEFRLDPEELAELPAAAAGEGSPTLATEGSLDGLLEPAVRRALLSLTDAERAVLLLRAMSELRYREIGESLDIPIGSVMGHLSRARQKMRAALQPHGRTTITHPNQNL